MWSRSLFIDPVMLAQFPWVYQRSLMSAVVCLTEAAPNGLNKCTLQLTDNAQFVMYGMYLETSQIVGCVCISKPLKTWMCNLQTQIALHSNHDKLSWPAGIICLFNSRGQPQQLPKPVPVMLRFGKSGVNPHMRGRPWWRSWILTPDLGGCHWVQFKYFLLSGCRPGWELWAWWGLKMLLE